MFLIMLTYKKPIEVVEQYIIEHREFLMQGYAKNYLVVSGPQKPRVGGVIISCLKDKKKLEDFIYQDPFYVQGIADYQIIEFEPVRCHQHFEYFLNP